MKQPDSKNRESFKIRSWAKVTKEDYADCALIASQYSQALSVGVWLSLLQEQPKVSLTTVFLCASVSFVVSFGFRLVSNRLRRL